MFYWVLCVLTASDGVTGRVFAVLAPPVPDGQHPLPLAFTGSLRTITDSGCILSGLPERNWAESAFRSDVVGGTKDKQYFVSQACNFCLMAINFDVTEPVSGE
jgi:hypothetical protein